MERDTTRFKISSIKRDDALKVRAEMNPDVIAAYAEQLRAGDPIPPIVVVYDGTDRWLADGYCRIAAALEVGLKALDVEVRSGVRRDALEYAFRRGIPTGRSNQEKRRDVKDCLKRYPMASDRAIARAIGTGHTFVAKVRAELASGTGFQIETTRNVSRGNSYYTQDTSRIGDKKKPAST
jgi:hypothetical protein